MTVLHFLWTASNQSDIQETRTDSVIMLTCSRRVMTSLVTLVAQSLENEFAAMGLKSIRAAHDFPTFPQAFPPLPAAASELNVSPSSDAFGRLNNIKKKPRALAMDIISLVGRMDRQTISIAFEITDPLRGTLFMFQNIDGRVVKYSTTADAFVMQTDAWIPALTLEILHWLSEVGWLYRRIKRTLERWKGGSVAGGEGLVRQGFCVAIQKKLTSHFHLITQLEDQFTKADLAGKKDFASKGLSLKRLLVWIHEPLLKLRVVSVLVDMSVGLRGGALLRVVHASTNHGDLFISVPFYQMLKRWLFEGELNDPFQEFFVVQDRSVDEAHMWRNQYVLKKEMIPSFFNRSVSKKVRRVSGFLEYGNSSLLKKSITTAYTSIGAYILDLLFGKYKLMIHLQASKKYLLLGHGDLVQNLMDKVGSRLCDVFTLDYRTDSPISTVFPVQSMHQYMKLFTFLWRLKRVEHTLSVAWRKGMTEYTVFQKMKGIRVLSILI
ncbi:Gamma-tubulin complex component 3 [Physocladia obscura]|uniref:Gamma-tubulin complex component 3 n=1 Tax=Physocladia obscura TaxID=109957 RepID=A0AAD5SXB8_9FUNG|nr:Gamma-tubulin complex component 3 [Physocladia obscura]